MVKLNCSETLQVLQQLLREQLPHASVAMLFASGGFIAHMAITLQAGRHGIGALRGNESAAQGLQELMFARCAHTPRTHQATRCNGERVWLRRAKYFSDQP